MNQIIQQYEEAKQALYDHVGFVEDWVVYAIDDQTDMWWEIDNGVVRYAEDVKTLTTQEGNYYEDEIYTQRFYTKHVYEGPDLTLIFCDPHIDGCEWFRIFDNKKRIQ